MTAYPVRRLQPATFSESGPEPGIGAISAPARIRGRAPS